jgi:pyrimidine dimer DNA glycosylase
MQTFLPYPSFRRTASVLDPRRLGKQRVEALQVLRAQSIPGYGWRHHPAVKMWRGHREALAAYGATICRAWIDLGHADTVLQQIEALAPDGLQTEDELVAHGLMPPWLGDEAFHRSHRSSLVRKDPDWYRRFFPDVPDDLPYVWPEP